MGDNKEEEFPANEIRVCIDSYGDDIGGRLYNRAQEEPIVFHRFDEMLLRADALLDRCGYPQAFQEKRDFVRKDRQAWEGTEPGGGVRREGVEHHGKLQTIDVLVRSRRQTNWQGWLISEKDGEAVEFGSEMKLLEYIALKVGAQGSRGFRI